MEPEEQKPKPEVIYTSNKKCLGCGEYMLYSKLREAFKCPYAFAKPDCLIITKEEVEQNELYGKEKLELKEL